MAQVVRPRGCLTCSEGGEQDPEGPSLGGPSLLEKRCEGRAWAGGRNLTLHPCCGAWGRGRAGCRRLGHSPGRGLLRVLPSTHCYLRGQAAGPSPTSLHIPALMHLQGSQPISCLPTSISIFLWYPGRRDVLEQPGHHPQPTVPWSSPGKALTGPLLPSVAPASPTPKPHHGQIPLQELWGLTWLTPVFPFRAHSIE